MDKIKNLALGLAGLMLAVGATTRISEQMVKLWQASRVNQRLGGQIEEYRAKNKDLEGKIKYGQTEEFFQRQSREYWGMGTKNDSWLELPPESSYAALRQKKEPTGEKSEIFWQWWKLFTGR